MPNSKSLNTKAETPKKGGCSREEEEEVCFQKNIEYLLRFWGLSLTNVVLLHILRDGPMKIKELKNRFERVSYSGISGALQELVKAELIWREGSKEDRRVKFVGLTPKGLDLFV